MLARVLGFYRQTLSVSPEAALWLERHLLADSDAHARFGVGFSDRSIGRVLPVKARDRVDDVRGRLQRVGVLRSSGHEHSVVVSHSLSWTLTAASCRCMAGPWLMMTVWLPVVTGGSLGLVVVFGTWPASRAR